MATKRRGISQVTLISLILVVGFGLAMYLSWPTGIKEDLHVNGSTGQTLAIPRRFNGLDLGQWTVGQAAVEQVTRLHGLDVGVRDGFLADYGQGQNHIMVWAGVAESEPAAATLVSRMTEAIGKGNSPYSDPQKRRIDGMDVYFLSGAGGDNFYYYSGNWAIWVTATSGDISLIAKEAMRTFPRPLNTAGY